MTAPLPPKPVNLPAEPPLTRMSNELASLRASVNKLARAQNALLFNVKALSDQVRSLSGTVQQMASTEGKLERTKRGASFTSLFASAARPTPTDPRIILMALRHDANDANLSRIADELIGIRELLEKMDHAQDALLENGQSLQGQLEALTGQITHMIQVLTPERPEQEGPSLADLLARILTQQSGMAALLRQINDALMRLTPAEAATAHANTPANGAGHA